MRAIVRKLMLASLLVMECGVAQARSYRPVAACTPLPQKDEAARLVCTDDDVARHALMFDQAWQALRHETQGVARDVLDRDVAAAIAVPETCRAEAQAEEGKCYAASLDRVAARYRERLSGNALEEALRPIDRHIALQQKLQDLGFLAPEVPVDGVYGVDTRQAIATWQRVARRPVADGFLSNADAAALDDRESVQEQPDDDTSADAHEPPPWPGGTGMEKIMTVDEVVGRQRHLDRQKVTIVARVYCADDICQATQGRGHPSITFSPDDLDAASWTTLSQCHQPEDGCVGKMTGTTINSWTGFTVELSDIKVKSLRQTP